MLKITKIHIRNFRSIENLSLETDQLNIFVGLNDSGKSNILKALNLFFNGTSDVNVPFNFDTNYSFLAPYKSNKAKEITIAVTFDIPDTYTDSGEVTLTKVWRKTGLHKEKTSKVFSARSKGLALLGRIVFKYVPAVRDENYFRSLLKDLYRCLSAEENSNLTSKTEEYSSALRKYTKRISEIVKDHLSLESVLEFRSDQSEIFGEAVFVTKDSLQNRVGLAFRGDGIKALHIPPILKFIAETESKTRTQGAIPYTTIWGYEEPENGLELTKCYDLAGKIYDFSAGFQIFLTTHSPAFYSAHNKRGVKVDLIEKADTCKTQRGNGADFDKLNEKIGLLPIIAPLIEKKYEELAQMRELVEKEFLMDVDTIFVEGITDKEYLLEAIKLFSPVLDKRLDDSKLRIFVRKENGGTTNLVGWVKGWIYVNFDSKLFVLLDHDAAGLDACGEIKELLKENHKEGKIKVLRVPPTYVIKTIYSEIVEQDQYEYAIESLFPITVWEVLKDRKFLVERSTGELSAMFAHKMTNDTTINGVVASVASKDQGIPILLYHKPHPDKKKQIKNLVFEMAKKDKSIFDGFKDLVAALERHYT